MTGMPVGAQSRTIAVAGPLLIAATLLLPARANAHGNEVTLAIKCAAEATISCNHLTDSVGPWVPVTTGGCGPVSLSFLDRREPDNTMEGQYTITRSWIVADTCGTKQTCTQILHVVPARPRIAVLAFENLAGSEEGTRVFARLVESELAQSGRTELVPAGDVESAVLRARIRVPMLMDEDQRARLAVSLTADYFILGSILAYETFEDPYAGPVPVAGIAMQVRDAKTGITVWSDTFHAIGNSGEWLFGLGVEHDITRLAHAVSRHAVQKIAPFLKSLPCDHHDQ